MKGTLDDYIITMFTEHILNIYTNSIKDAMYIVQGLHDGYRQSAMLMGHEGVCLI
jgi:hypothetical protein